MKLVELSYKEATKLRMPDFQRASNTARVNALKKFYAQTGKYSSTPILANSKGFVIDGGHRLSAYLRATEERLIGGKILVLIDPSADKDTFLEVNKGMAVSLAHKIKIHPKIIELEIKGFRLASKNSSLSLFYVDFAQALSLLVSFMDGQPLGKQARQAEIFNNLNATSSDKLEKYASIVFSHHRRYFAKIGNRKFNKRLFLYTFWASIKFGISDNDIERLIVTYPSFLRGELDSAFNKQEFLDIFNYKKRSNFIKFEDF